ncbi:50S ribosomal protein L11 methyltransferase [Carboxylicivirga mesophila]|uniref:Ribosomal protein L11 methyltransferase n=1 Tax=Carboxylicivirga mesophila TaxID=1166478 RepID=A0ABS5K7P4_9BACT|nr:50S ribosomal protein L11 methyltransferase [Carboxylicivirga mesophila]MBS2211004.1 50S ribosomal protein L11 methyltransferase [Carboxylicivirga mesophila]
MEYTKVSVLVMPPNEVANELLIAQLGEMGFDSFEENDKGFDAFIPSKDFANANLEELYCPIEGIKWSYSSEVIADQNWNKVWEENFFQPIIIGDDCIIRSSFHQVEHHCQYDIIIDPRMAFGTGHHETTSLMVQHILEADVKRLDVLDMGCGTAILGMLCAMKGATDVIGIDIDEWAYNNALDNLQLNHISNMQIQLGGAELLGDKQYDLILANINRNILLNDMVSYANVLRTNGKIFFSGFYTEDLPAIDAEAVRHGLTMISQKTDNNWTAVAYIKAE